MVVSYSFKRDLLYKIFVSHNVHTNRSERWRGKKTVTIYLGIFSYVMLGNSPFKNNRWFLQTLDVSTGNIHISKGNTRKCIGKLGGEPSSSKLDKTRLFFKNPYYSLVANGRIASLFLCHSSPGIRSLLPFMWMCDLFLLSLNNNNCEHKWKVSSPTSAIKIAPPELPL